MILLCLSWNVWTLTFTKHYTLSYTHTLHLAWIAWVCGTHSPYISSHLSNIAFMGKLHVHWKTVATNRRSQQRKCAKKSPTTHKQNVTEFNYSAPQHKHVMVSACSDEYSMWLALNAKACMAKGKVFILYHNFTTRFWEDTMEPTFLGPQTSIKISLYLAAFQVTFWFFNNCQC